MYKASPQPAVLSRLIPNEVLLKQLFQAVHYSSSRLTSIWNRKQLQVERIYMTEMQLQSFFVNMVLNKDINKQKEKKRIYSIR